jgi:hypothetical protein
VRPNTRFLLDRHAVFMYSIVMSQLPQLELDSARAAEELPMRREHHKVIRWRSSFGLVLIEVRGEQVFVNGELVERAGPPGGDDL